MVEAQRGAREKRWGPPTLNKCLKTHGEWFFYFSPLDKHQGSSCWQWRCSGGPGACIRSIRDSRQLLTDVYSEQSQEAVEPLLEIWGQTDILRLDQEAEVCKTGSEASQVQMYSFAVESRTQLLAYNSLCPPVLGSRSRSVSVNTLPPGCRCPSMLLSPTPYSELCSNAHQIPVPA